MAHVNPPINSHLDRLAYDEIRERPSLFGETWLPSLLGIAGFSMLAVSNVAVNKPMHTGLWRAALIVPACVAAGVWLREYNKENSREKWAKIRHYIELHPEDFPPYPARTKIGETLAPWIPRRTGW